MMTLKPHQLWTACSMRERARGRRVAPCRHSDSWAATPPLLQLGARADISFISLLHKVRYCQVVTK